MKTVKKFDFYTVQICVDGFGNDTCGCSVWRTKEEAENAIEKLEYKGCWGCFPEVVGGFFGKDLYLAFG